MPYKDPVKQKEAGTKAHRKWVKKIGREEWNRRSAERMRKSRTLNKDAERNRQYMYKYGITLEEYNKIFEEQKGCCSICGRHQCELKKRLCIDHRHDGGQIRGLLCHRCNLMIGTYEESIELLKSSIQYLEYYNERNEDQILPDLLDSVNTAEDNL